MSLGTPTDDDSGSSEDRLEHSSLAAYDSIPLPGSGIWNMDEISALSNKSKAEDPSCSSSSVGEQDAVGPGKDNQSTNTLEAPILSTQTSKASMFDRAHDFSIGNHSALYNIAVRCGDNSLVIVLIISCLVISLLIPGVYHRTPTANPSTDAFPDFSPRAEIHYMTNREGTKYGLGRLEEFVSQGAINGSYIQDRNRQVHPGTRERVQRQIKAWIDNPSPTKHILWLHGPAGVGKSTIAQTITYSYTPERIPPNFFFFRSDSDRNDGNRLFTTLAWQFTTSIPAIKRHIEQSLIEQPDLPRKDVETQFQELIVRPFEALSNYNRPPRLSPMIVVIDGVDECVDTHLQERILNVIGNVGTKIRVPLRFFIISRPEARIQKNIDRFKRHTLIIDLADSADADRDIEKYLKDKFKEIAKDQDFDPAIWPDQKTIQQLVVKASGQFIYASTVIRFVCDEDYNAQIQLDIVLGLKPRTTTQPFAELDRIYIEILERQSDQKFLKDFLPLLAARYWDRRPRPSACIDPPFPSPHCGIRYDCSFYYPFCTYNHLRPGYGILMDMSQQELRKKLRNMRSLLKFPPDDITLHQLSFLESLFRKGSLLDTTRPDDITLHHLSFLEFLHDPSRSGLYNISAEGAVKQQLVLVIASVVRAAEQAFDQPNYHPPVSDEVQRLQSHKPGYHDVLSGDELQEVSRPLLKFKDRLYDLPNIIPRNECTIFHVVNSIISTFSPYWPGREKKTVKSLELQNLVEGFSKGTFDLMITLLSVKPEVVAMTVHSWLEAQDLMDRTYLVVTTATNRWGIDVARKAIQLAFEIHTRIPVLPQFIDSAACIYSPYSVLRGCWGCELETFSQMVLIGKFLDHQYILAAPSIRQRLCGFIVFRYYLEVSIDCDEDESPINDWRKSTDPSHKEMMFIMLNLAKTIQYLHSMGFVLSDRIRLDDIYVDSKFRVRISSTKLVHRHLLQKVDRYETGINTFLSVFCMMYFGTFAPSCTTSWRASLSRATRTSLSKPESGVPGDVGRLIQRCLSTEDKPTIDEVVQEMESFWKFWS